MFVSKQIALIKFSMFLFWAVSSGVQLKYDSPAIPPKQWVSIATCARFWLDNGFRSGADLVKKICVGVSDLCGSLAGSDNPSWPQRRFIYATVSFLFQISTSPSNQAQTGWPLPYPGCMIANSIPARLVATRMRVALPRACTCHCYAHAHGHTIRASARP